MALGGWVVTRREVGARPVLPCLFFSAFQTKFQTTMPALLRHLRRCALPPAVFELSNHDCGIGSPEVIVSGGSGGGSKRVDLEAEN